MADLETGEGLTKPTAGITCLFVDIGGVLLTDGWTHEGRKRAGANFDLDLAEMEDRHHLTFDTYEEGKLTLDEYLGRVVFYRERPFTRAQFRAFMFAQSEPHPEMIDLVTQLKARHGLKVAVVSNEGRELNAYRINEFHLDKFADFFCLALDIAQVPARQVVYVENTPMFVQVAEGLGIKSILHTDYTSTCAQLASFGLNTGDRALDDSPNPAGSAER